MPLPTQTLRWSLPESETESSEPDQGSRVMGGVTQPGQGGQRPAKVYTVHLSPEGPDCPGLSRPAAGT